MTGYVSDGMYYGESRYAPSRDIVRRERDRLREEVRALKDKYEPARPVRIGDRERHAVTEHLTAAYEHGYLPLAAFYDRLDQAAEAEYARDLPVLTADLPSLRVIAPPEPVVAVVVKRRYWWQVWYIRVRVCAEGIELRLAGAR